MTRRINKYVDVDRREHPQLIGMIEKTEKKLVMQYFEYVGKVARTHDEPSMAAFRTKQEFDSLDMIKLTIKDLDQIKNQIRDGRFVKYIPCYEIGAMVVDDAHDGEDSDRELEYLMWQVSKLDIEEEKMEILLWRYYYDEKNDFWGCEFAAKLYLEGHDGDECRVSYDMMDYPLEVVKVDDIGMLLKWSKAERKIFKGMKNRIKEEWESDGGKANEQAIGLFLILMNYLSNSVFGADNVSKSYGEEKSHEKARQIIGDIVNGENRKYRRPKKDLDGMEVEFLSEKKPKRITPREIRYSTPSWKQRGHMRHYKSGKTVWIKEQVKERKILKDKASGFTPSKSTWVVDV